MTTFEESCLRRACWWLERIGMAKRDGVPEVTGEDGSDAWALALDEVREALGGDASSVAPPSKGGPRPPERT
jgi:hypothetical protein